MSVHKTSLVKTIYVLVAIISVVLIDQYYADSTKNFVKVEEPLSSSDLVAMTSKKQIDLTPDDRITEVEVHRENRVMVVKNAIPQNDEIISKDSEVLSKLQQMFDPEEYEKIVLRYENRYERYVINSYMQKGISKDEMRTVLAPFLNEQNGEAVAVSNVTVQSGRDEVFQASENPYKELQDNPEVMLRRIENSSNEITPDNPYYNLINSLPAHNQ